MIGAAGRSTLCAASRARSRISASSTSASTSSTSHSSSIQSCRFTTPDSSYRTPPRNPLATAATSRVVRSTRGGRAGPPRCRRRGPRRRRRRPRRGPAAPAAGAAAARAGPRRRARPRPARGRVERRQRAGAGRRRRPAARRRARRPRRSSRRTVAGVTRGMSTASTTTGRGTSRKRVEPASRPAAGPPRAGPRARRSPAGWSGTGSPTTTTSAASTTASSACSSRVAPPSSMEALSTPSIRAAVPPARTTAAELAAVQLQSRGQSRASGWHGVAVAHRPAAVRVRCVQQRLRLDPAENRALLAELAVADGRRPGGLPRGVRPRLRRGRLRRPRVRRAAGRAVRRTSSAGSRTRRGTTVVAGMFEVSRRPRPPVQHAGRRAATAAGVVPQDPPLRLVRLPRVRPAHAPGDLEPVLVERRRLHGRPDDLLRPALPRARPRAGRRRRRGARACRPLGRRASARSTTGAPCSRARAIENTVYVVGVGQPGPRYTGHSLVVDPLGDVLAEAGDGDERARRAVLDRRSSRGPPDQPLAGQPPAVTFTSCASCSPTGRPSRKLSTSSDGAPGSAGTAAHRAPLTVWALADARRPRRRLCGWPPPGLRPPALSRHRRGHRRGVVHLGAGGAHRRPSGGLRRRWLLAVGVAVVLLDEDLLPAAPRC